MSIIFETFNDMKRETSDPKFNNIFKLYSTLNYWIDVYFEIINDDDDDDDLNINMNVWWEEKKRYESQKIDELKKEKSKLLLFNIMEFIKDTYNILKKLEKKIILDCTQGKIIKNVEEYCNYPIKQVLSLIFINICEQSIIPKTKIHFSIKKKANFTENLKLFNTLKYLMEDEKDLQYSDTNLCYLFHKIIEKIPTEDEKLTLSNILMYFSTDKDEDKLMVEQAIKEGNISMIYEKLKTNQYIYYYFLLKFTSIEKKN